MSRALDHLVGREMNFRHLPHLQETPKLRAEKAGHMVETLLHFGGRLLAEHAVEDLGVTQVGRHLDGGDRDERDARILDLTAQQFREPPLQLASRCASRADTRVARFSSRRQIVRATSTRE